MSKLTIFIWLRHVSITMSGVTHTGWTASIGIVRTAGGSTNSVAQGESVIHSSKEAAWNSVDAQARKLDYNENDIYFNGVSVGSYDKVMQEVAKL